LKTKTLRDRSPQSLEAKRLTRKILSAKDLSIICCVHDLRAAARISAERITASARDLQMFHF
jgi:hypothetical protein